MENGLFLAAGMLLMPLLYEGFLWKEKKRMGRPLSSAPEVLVLLLGELALICVWRAEAANAQAPLKLLLFFVMLTAMTAFCMEDYWERIVPNRLLLFLVFVWILLVGVQGVLDMEAVLALLPSMILGEIFCGVSFGLGYLLSRGSMGAGDVKLALVMGAYLTGDYAAGTVLYGCIAAAVFSLVQLMRKKLSRKDSIPFVPFLYIGLVINCLRLLW